MTEHAKTCDRPTPVVRLFTVAGTSYCLSTCPRCGTQSVQRNPESKE